MEVRHPEWLQLELENKTTYGYNQSWYPTSFKRTRGCGPTTAAMLLSYLNRREGQPLPYQCDDIPSIVRVLEDVWGFITPGWLLGLNSTGKFCKGAEALLRRYGVKWRCHRLSVAAVKARRASLASVVSFVEAGLASDCPVAFLNLHRGRETALDSWHWMVLVSLVFDQGGNRYLATCYDCGRRITFDLGRWLETTRLGGGFVYLTAGVN